MIDDWQEIDTAPKNEAVLVCQADCTILVATQYSYEGEKKKQEWAWKIVPDYYQQYRGYVGPTKPKMWRPLPLPPKHLYERKLTADLLEKQVKQLREE